MDEKLNGMAERARSLILDDNPQSALKAQRLIAMVKAGDKAAIMSLGAELCNAQSNLFRSDRFEGLKFLEYAGEVCGIAEAWARIGDVLVDPTADFQDYERAFTAYDKGRHTNQYAQTKYGLLLLIGLGCAKDEKRGLEELEKSPTRETYWAPSIHDSKMVPNDLALNFIPRDVVRDMGIGGMCPLQDFASYLLPQAQTLRREGQSKATATPAAADKPVIDGKRELERLIGLDGVKEMIKGVVAVIQFSEQRRHRGLPALDRTSHLVFTGNPGTGKTIVARILGSLLKDAGYLTSGHVVEVSAPEIIGQWVGETSQKATRKLKESLGGILFIDEAYSLASHPTAGGGDFGHDAIVAILKFMEDHRGEFVLVAAGYPKEMESFLDSNPGLKSRFTEFIEFPDYKPRELELIYNKMLKDVELVLEDAARPVLARIMTEAPKLFEEQFSNARFVRNVFEDTVKYMALRLADSKEPSRQQLTTILEADLLMAYAENKGNENHDRHQVGFIRETA